MKRVTGQKEELETQTGRESKDVPPQRTFQDGTILLASNEAQKKL